jgi:hypothetical protein
VSCILLCRSCLHGERVVVVLIVATFDPRLHPVVYLFLVSYGRARPDLIEKCIPHFDAVRRNVARRAVY